jgi:hypothetical protein
MLVFNATIGWNRGGETTEYRYYPNVISNHVERTVLGAWEALRHDRYGF